VCEIGSEKKHLNNAPAPFSTRDTVTALALGLVLFALLCLCSASTVKGMAIVLCFALLAGSFIWFSALRDRIALPVIALALYTVMDGVSASYAIAGKFALYEFLKVLCAFCLALLLTAAAPGKGARPVRWIGTLLATATAAAGLVSIDLLSTHWISDGVLGLLADFTPDYSELSGVEAGVRMTSVFNNPNVFAGCAGIGVLLSLGLSVSAKESGERCADCALLYVNSLSFVLAFSMGGSGAIACAFAVYLLLEKERRAESFALMLATLVLTIVSAAVISTGSFGAWKGTNPVPLLCTVLGAAALCLADRFAGRRVYGARLLRGRALPLLTLALVGALAAYVLAAWNWTGPVTLGPGETLRRAAYPQAGTYVLRTRSDAGLSVSIESQNSQETMMHSSTALYSGDAAEAEFTVPEDSLVVYFNFRAPEGAGVESVRCEGEDGTVVEVPLGYRLLPGFIANRLQGLFANENAIQRFVFFSDGMKLFRRSPALGLGMGAYENAVKSVQPFYYETKYVHNHYIQALVETGVVGLVLFVSLLAVSAVSVLRAGRREEPPELTSALGAALVFMAVHAAVEVVFSSYPYLPLAFGVFALINLSCGESLTVPRLGRAAKSVSLLCVCGFAAVYGVLTLMNVRASQLVASEATFQSLEAAARMDKFEWADYLLTYVDSSTGPEANDEVRAKAETYAERLAQVESNSVPYFLAEYYFKTGNTLKALDMLEKYVGYVPSDPAAWNEAFHMLGEYGSDTDSCREGVLRLTEKLEEWTARNMGEIELDEAARSLIARYTQ